MAQTRESSPPKAVRTRKFRGATISKTAATRYTALLAGVCTLLCLLAGPFTRHAAGAEAGLLADVSPQPLMEQVRRLQIAMDFLGQPLSARDQEQIRTALASRDMHSATASIEGVLEQYVLATVTISPESRVGVRRGIAAPRLVQDGARLFLIKVVNQAGVTAPLAVDSPSNGSVYVPSTGNPEPPQRITMADVRERWASISLFTQPPMEDRLSGFPLEYRILVISSRDAGQRTAKLSFNVGQGSQDVGFLSEVSILFTIAPSKPITLHVLDADGQRTMGSFVFRDSHGRIYPNPLKRLAPDFYFQPQVYRSDGEDIQLPPGNYTATYTGGPEYITKTQDFVVGTNTPSQLSFRLDRWIDPARYGWYSGDDHIHPAGCSHYENPTEGVSPADMSRQVMGEHLNVGAVLVWGPCFYYQQHFFRGQTDDPTSTSHSLIHYDLEVSGFPSSHAGHLVLLDLKQMMYPGTKRIEQWPTWDLPVLRWAKSQGAAAGFAHSGWGLAVRTNALPNYEMPAFDGIGANEYVVDVTYPNTVDFISLGDTPYLWELNIWYQILNVGFRTRISGETDFPCIYDSRVGQGRTYAKVRGPLTYDSYVKALRDGAVYVSDGRSHLMNFAVNHTEMGTHGSQVDLAEPETAQVSVDAAAYLPSTPNTAIDELPYNERPYWDLERSRIGTSRKVPVEVVVNGEAVAKKEIVADGSIQKLTFDIPIVESSWVAVRILPSSHTNPLFLLVNGKPIRASRQSAEWCLRSVNQCWSQKAPKISAQELPEARQAYEHARDVYRRLITESGDQK
jgi:hypothetical protein